VHDGTTRIERGLIRELPPLLGERLGFCIYDRTMKRFLAVPLPALPEAAAAAKRPTARRSAARALGRRVERRVRGLVKGAAARTAAALDIMLERRLFPSSRAGDVLLLAGENWSRYDFDMLRRLRKDHGVRIAAVLQDMIPVVHPQFFDDAAFLIRFRAYLDFLARDADLVFAISDATRNDFLRTVPEADPERVERIELGSDIATSNEQQRPAALPDLAGRPFVLSVSTIQARKNFDLLYRLWQRLSREGRTEQPHLVIAGRPGFGSSDLLHLMRNDPAIAGTVTLLHGTSDAELAWLYANCLFTLYPSWYEGWGLPLSESLAQGKTFIASNTSSLPEAGQGLGIHLDPYDLIAWQSEVLRLTRDERVRAALERRIQTERKLSTWSDCARQIGEALNRFMN